jgi:hypothetical protein
MIIFTLLLSSECHQARTRKGTLTEGEGSVPLTPYWDSLLCRKENNCWQYQKCQSKLVGGSTVLPSRSVRVPWARDEPVLILSHFSLLHLFIEKGSQPLTFLPLLITVLLIDFVSTFQLCDVRQRGRRRQNLRNPLPRNQRLIA